MKRTRTGPAARIAALAVLVVLAALSGAGCRAPASVSLPWFSGPRDPESGKLIALWVDLRKRYGVEKPVVLQRDHGMLIVWRGEERRFFVYDDTRGAVAEARDFAEFLRLVEGLPEGATVEWIDSCCAPLFYEMPKEEHRRLYAVLEKGKKTETRSGRGEPFIVCTCESDGLLFPGPPGPPGPEAEETREVDLPSKRPGRPPDVRA